MPEMGNVYVTIDIDGLDPSIAPGTGSPTVDGLLYHEVKDLKIAPDLARARTLLAETKYSKGFNITIHMPVGRPTTPTAVLCIT